MSSRDKRVYSQQIGYAGEYSAASELLFRGYTTEVVSIDAGVDLVCWKGGVPKQIQVKTRKENPNRPGSFVFALREKSFNIPDYFIFVARRVSGRNDFVVIPKSLVHSLVQKGDIKFTKRKTGGYYRVNMRFGKDGKVWIQKRENDVTLYLNNWVL